MKDTKKMEVTKVVALVVAVLFVFPAVASAGRWDWVSGMTAGSDDAFENPLNWWDAVNTGHGTPVAGDEINIGTAWNPTSPMDVKVNSNTDLFTVVNVGITRTAEMTINAGATFNANVLTAIGAAAGSDGSSITVNGSLLLNDGTSFGALIVGDVSDGSLVVNDGAVVDVAALWLGRNGGNGTVQINGGSVYVGHSPMLGTDSGSLMFGTGNAHIDITGGQLVIDNLPDDIYYWYKEFNNPGGLIDSGIVTAYGGAGNLEFDMNANDQLIITAVIPEPATLCLLGLGGLLLGRKKRLS